MADLDTSTQHAREIIAREIATGKRDVSSFLLWLDGTSRSKRQHAASILALVAGQNPVVLKEYVKEIANALTCPEAPTRWEALNILDALGKQGQRYSDETIELASDALYDGKSGIVREAAFRFFCDYGAVSAINSDKVWPFIDEAIQCYHGNPEFNDMLVALVEFSQGSISGETRAALAERMRFDAENASGTLRMRSEQIVAVCGK